MCNLFATLKNSECRTYAPWVHKVRAPRGVHSSGLGQELMYVFSTHPTLPSCAEKDKTQLGISYPDCSQMAPIVLVPQHSPDVSVTSHNNSILPFFPDLLTQNEGKVQHHNAGWFGFMAWFLDGCGTSCSEAVQTIFNSSRKESIRKCYSSKWRQLTVWCQQQQLTPENSDIPCILEYLFSL